MNINLKAFLLTLATFATVGLIILIIWSLVVLFSWLGPDKSVIVVIVIFGTLGFWSVFDLYKKMIE